MGMLGGYNAHYFCDCCNKFAEVNDQVYSAAQANKVIRAMKWILLPDGSVICDSCAAKPRGELVFIPEPDREGVWWQNYS